MWLTISRLETSFYNSRELCKSSHLKFRLPHIMLVYNIPPVLLYLSIVYDSIFPDWTLHFTVVIKCMSTPLKPHADNLPTHKHQYHERWSGLNKFDQSTLWLVCFTCKHPALYSCILSFVSKLSYFYIYWN